MEIDGISPGFCCVGWGGTPAKAQEFNFLPEVDFYSHLTSNLRFQYQAKETREAGDPTQAEVGPSFDYSIGALSRLRELAIFEADQTKNMALNVSAGFRYVAAPDKAPTERMELVATPKLPLMWHILLLDRNRMDLDWQKEKFTWRYRNQVKLERRIRTWRYHPAPYVAAEVFYESQYTKWGTTALYAGCLMPVNKHVEFDPYYEHQNITTGKPNKQLNQFGLILNVYY